MTQNSTVSIRCACPTDIPVIVNFLHLLAAHDGHADQCRVTDADIEKFAFSDKPCIEIILIEVDGEPQGLALFFMTFTVWYASQILFLSDLYVNPNCRGLGLGKRLFAALAKIALERKCCRMDWQVLPEAEASGFYKKLGARKVDDFHSYQLGQEGMKALAEE